MKSKLSVFRLAVILLFLLSMVSPLVTAGAAAQAVACEDFSTRDEAQDALDDDPDTAETLDEDGDGVACEDLPTRAEATSDDRVKAEDVQLPDEDATEDEPDSDVDDYLVTIQDEVDALQTSVDDFLAAVEITGAESTSSRTEQEDATAEANEIAEGWAGYPDVAAEITATAPDGVEDITSAYQDLAETTGQAGEQWGAFSNAPVNTAIFELFSTTFDTMQDQLDELNLLLEEGASGTATPEATEESSEDGDAYIATIQAEVDTLQTSVDDFIAAVEVAGDETGGRTERADAVDELNEIAATWADYPDVAAEITATAPDGVEEITTAYEDLAETTGQAGDDWAVYWDAPQDSPEEDDAFDAFTESLATMQDQLDELTLLLDEGANTGTGTGTPEATDEATEEPTEEATEEPTEDATEEPSGDADEYLTAVREHTDELSESIDRFNEILAAGDFTDEEVVEFAEILELWADSPDVAAELEAPTGFSEIEDAYLELTDELAAAAESFGEFGQADPDSPESEQALQDFQDALANAETLAADLDELLTDEGV